VSDARPLLSDLGFWRLWRLGQNRANPPSNRRMRTPWGIFHRARS